jgi:glucose/arabinose dehydrogenase
MGAVWLAIILHISCLICIYNSMKSLISLLVILVVVGLSIWYVTRNNNTTTSQKQAVGKQNSSGTNLLSEPTVLAENLDTPWAVAILPDKSMLITERNGTVRKIDQNNKLIAAPIATLQAVEEVGEGGLLGIAIHPEFPSNNAVYLYYTYSGRGNATLNRVVTMRYENNQLQNEQILLDQIPGAPNHNGGRLAFGPDKFLYIGTGDAQEPSLAQDRNSLAGKILRVTDTGEPAPGNPFGNEVYSFGHRNVQGFAWDSTGMMWATEHGPSGGVFGRGNDELNRIEPGKNYGWPEIQGDQTRSGMVVPVRHSGTLTWAPAGAAVVGDTLFFVGLRGETLYEATITGNTITDFKEHFTGEYGRLREVARGSSGGLILSTSNQDGRGNPSGTDDRIIRINPQSL